MIEPQHDDGFTFVPVRPGLNHIAADRLLSDGRRTSAQTTFNATLAVPNSIETYTADPANDFDVVAWYQLDGDYTDAKGLQPNATPTGGSEAFDSSSFTWATRPGGQALRLNGLGDGASVTIPQHFVDAHRATAISVEAMVMFDAYPASSAPLLQLVKPGTSAELIWGFDENLGPYLNAGTIPLLTDTALSPLYAPNVWHHLRIQTSTDPFAGYRIYIDGTLAHETITGEFSIWDLELDAELRFGNFSGWIDEVIVRSVGTVGPPDINLLGGDLIRLRVGDSFSDPGAEAFDYLGNSLTVTPTGSVDPNTPGTYQISYSATDSSGETNTAILTVIVDVAPQAGERVAVYRFDTNAMDSLARQTPLALSGGATVVGGKLATGSPSGSATLTIPSGDLVNATDSFGFAFEFELAIDSFAAGDTTLFSLTNGTDIIAVSKLSAKAGISMPGIATAAELGISSGSSHHLRVVLTLDGYAVSVDGNEVATAMGSLTGWTSNDATLSLGAFSGKIDNLILTNIHPAVSGTVLVCPPSKTYITMGDNDTFNIPEADIYVDGASTGIAIEAEIIIGAYPGYTQDTAKIISLEQNYDTYFYFARDTWSTKPGVYAAFLDEIAAPTAIDPLITTGVARRVIVRLDTEGYQIWVANRLVSQIDDPAALARWKNNNDATFEIGNFDGTLQNPKVTRLEAPPEEPFAAWASRTIDLVGDRSENADPDGDGATNLEEFIFASDPMDANSAPNISLTESGGSTIEFTTSTIAASSTQYVVEGSDDLQTWSALPGSPVVVSENANTRVLSVALDSSSTRKFYRITVTIP